jgi:hypothetical protein
MRRERFNFIHRKECQKGQAVFYIRIVDVAEILIKLVGRRFFRIKPQRALFRLAHFFAFAVYQQLERHPVSFISRFSCGSPQRARPMIFDHWSVSAELHILQRTFNF